MIPTWSAVLNTTGGGDPAPLDSLGAWQVVLGRTALQGLCCLQALPSGQELSILGHGAAAAPTQHSSAWAVGIHPVPAHTQRCCVPQGHNKRAMGGTGEEYSCPCLAVQQSR